MNGGTNVTSPCSKPSRGRGFCSILKSVLLFLNLNDLNADKLAACAALDIIAQAWLVCFYEFISNEICIFHCTVCMH